MCTYQGQAAGAWVEATVTEEEATVEAVEVEVEKVRVEVKGKVEADC